MFRKQIEKLTASSRTNNISQLGCQELVDIRNLFNFFAKTYLVDYKHLILPSGQVIAIKTKDLSLVDEGIIIFNDEYMLTKDGRIDGDMVVDKIALATIHVRNTLLIGYPEQYAHVTNGNDLVVLPSEEALQLTIKDLGLTYNCALGDNKGATVLDCLDNVSYVQFEVPQLGKQAERHGPIPKTRLVTYSISSKPHKFVRLGKCMPFLKGLTYSSFYSSYNK